MTNTRARSSDVIVGFEELGPKGFVDLNVIDSVLVGFGQGMGWKVGIINNVIEIVETRKDDRERGELLCKRIECLT